MSPKPQKTRGGSDRNPTNWCMSILSTTTSDTDPTFIFDFEQPGEKYIFNAGQNTSRAFTQSKWGVIRTKGVFLTGIGEKRAAGLASLLMTFADAGPAFPRMDVMGPPGLKHLLASMRNFMYRESLPVVSTEVPFSEFKPNPIPKPIFKDWNITVYAIPIYPSGSGYVSSSHSNTNTSESSLKRKRSLADTAETSSPIKKQNTDGSIGEEDAPMSTAEQSSSSDSASLTSLLSSPSFSPAALPPSQAQEWRDMMVDVMFPASKTIGQKNKGKGKGPAPKESRRKDKWSYAAKDGNVDDYGRPQLISGYHAQLPRFTLAEILPSALSLSYLVIGPRIRGKFDGAKAEAMGVPRPLRKNIANGETVQFKRKKTTNTSSSSSATTEVEMETITVGPADLVEPSDPATAVLILDVPSPEHVPALFETFRGQNGYAKWTGWKEAGEDAMGETNAEAVKNETEPQEDFVLRTVIHLCGEGVWESKRYREFIAGFGEREDIHHILSSKSHLPDPLTFTSSGYHQLKLNQLDPDIFKVPKWRLKAEKNLGDDGDIPTPKNLTLMKPYMVIPMRPLGPPQRARWALENDRFHGYVGGEGTSESTVTDTAAISKESEATDEEVTAPEEKDETEALKTAITYNTSSLPEPSTLILKPRTAAAFAQGRAAVAAFSESAKMLETVQAMKGADVGIITLGTGSAVPGKYRNVSATVIQIPNHGNILLDCGEGTWGQLCRYFGTETSSLCTSSGPTENTASSSSSSPPTQNVYQFLRDLKCIYVSHVHADHHLGVAQLLAMRKKLHPAPTHPCYLVTLRPVHLYLRELSDLEDLGLVYGDEDASFNSNSNKNGVIPILSPALHWKQADSYVSGFWNVGGTEEWLDMARSRANAADMCRSLGLKSFFSVDVRHRTRCYGAVIRSEDGWSVVFSADTTPSDSLVYAQMAAQKAHSTVGQAITIGTRSNEGVQYSPYHFSARQPKIPHQIANYPSSSIANQSVRSDDSPFIVTAFDYANLTIGNMWKMQFYMAAIEQSYEEMLVEVGEQEEAEEEEREKLAKAGGSV
ncbi:hypothetical protein BT96DRAFT_928646 [Gymnopus androsaceus JB14]|uniref:ribonuclease Z n=1 Tax=Gymnopus androsaceus JB14 TaxID=1447944 RepID=A0A6A4GJH5_9AGAR|nr:hypothetical protein BT96DRAFT_928646 [Gymnopus androsaceus JB14]